MVIQKIHCPTLPNVWSGLQNAASFAKQKSSQAQSSVRNFIDRHPLPAAPASLQNVRNKMANVSFPTFSDLKDSASKHSRLGAGVLTAFGLLAVGYFSSRAFSQSAGSLNFNHNLNDTCPADRALALTETEDASFCPNPGFTNTSFVQKQNASNLTDFAGDLGLTQPSVEKNLTAEMDIIDLDLIDNEPEEAQNLTETTLPKANGANSSDNSIQNQEAPKGKPVENTDGVTKNFGPINWNRETFSPGATHLFERNEGKATCTNQAILVNSRVGELTVHVPSQSDDAMIELKDSQIFKLILKSKASKFEIVLKGIDLDFIRSDKTVIEGYSISKFSHLKDGIRISAVLNPEKQEENRRFARKHH